MQTKQRQVSAGTTFHLAQRSFAIPQDAGVEGDCYYVSGRDGGQFQVTKADAAAHAKAHGHLYVARAPIKAGRVGKATDVFLPFYTLFDVDTSAATYVGQPVFLKDGGGWSLTPGTVRRQIGQVVKIATAANGGAVLLAPNEYGQSRRVRSTANVAAGGTTVTVSLGSQFANAHVVGAVPTTSIAGTSALYVESAEVDGLGDLTITLDQDPVAGPVTVQYTVEA